MHKILRTLPSLDFLRGFEAAGRRLSFTLAAEELFLTQSALSRQIKSLEDALGLALFERRHRALALTPAGAAFHRDVAAALAALASATENVRGIARTPGLVVSTTVSFASLWIMPRLTPLRVRHPDVEVYVGVANAKAREPRTDPERCERHRRRHHEAGGARDAAHVLGRGRQRGERGGHVAMKRRAGRRQRERAMPPLEEREAERILQRLDLPRQRRLREEQLLGGQGERQPPPRRLEAAQEVE